MLPKLLKYCRENYEEFSWKARLWKVWGQKP